MIDTTKYQTQLETELAQLESELTTIAVKTESGWIPKASELMVDQADQNEVADSMEDAGEHTALLHDLNVRYQSIQRALSKIEKGSYGVDEIDGEPIEEDRLDANPAARTRKANIEREAELDT